MVHCRVAMKELFKGQFTLHVHTVASGGSHQFWWKIVAISMCIISRRMLFPATTDIVDLIMRLAQFYLPHQQVLYYPFQYYLRLKR